MLYTLIAYILGSLYEQNAIGENRILIAFNFMLATIPILLLAKF
jgi:hypothetical protein